MKRQLRNASRRFSSFVVVVVTAVVAVVPVVSEVLKLFSDC